MQIALLVELVAQITLLVAQIFEALDDCDIAGGTSLDLDGDGWPDDCPCAGDIDGDGVVGFSDLLEVLGSWQNPYTFEDLLLVLGNWGTCP